MTAQAHDTVRWRGADYLLVGVSGTGLFDPFEHGLDPRPTTTANWRGWVARYAIRDKVLFLADLHDVGLSAEQWGSPPAVAGVIPRRDDRGPLTYPNLQLPIEFTGRLIIARGFIQSLYRHMGFHPAWKFEESWELQLVGGLVTDEKDLSNEMQTMRERIETGEVADPDDPSRPGWIQRTFGLDFRRSKGR